MTSKELLIRELDTLGPLEILQIRNYVHKLKSLDKKKSSKKSKADINAARKSLSKIKGSISHFVSSGREDRS